MGEFDDLIPQETQTEEAAPPPGQEFSDLVPKAPPVKDEFSDLVPPAEQPRAGVLETVGMLGQQIGDLTTHVPAAVSAAIAGGNVTPGSLGDRRIEASRELSRQRQKEYGTGPTMIPFISKEDIAGLGPSLGFSIPSTATGLVVGKAGQAVGAPLGPIGAGVVGTTAGMTAAGTVAYRQSVDGFVRDIRDKANEDRKAKGLPSMTPEEFHAKQEQLAPLIREYGLWEAVPEAAGSALEFGILKAPIKAGIGKIFGDSVAKRLVTKAGSLYGTELATETVTQHGQHNVGVKAGTEQGEERSWTSPKDLYKSYSEIAGPTILQTTLMAGAFRLAQGRRADGSAPTQQEVDQAYRELSDKDPPSPPPPGGTVGTPSGMTPAPSMPTESEWDKLIKAVSQQDVAQLDPQVEFARGKPNELELLRQREGQIVRDLRAARKAGQITPEDDGVEGRSGLTAVRNRIREIETALPDIGPITPAPEPRVLPYEGPIYSQDQFDATLTRAGTGVADNGYGLHFSEDDAVGDSAPEMQSRIRAPREAFLDLDTPIASQPAVRKKIPDQLLQTIVAATGTQLGEITGRQVLQAAEAQLGPEGAARALQELDIPGTRYMNEGTTAKGRPTQSFAVFDRRALGIPLQQKQSFSMLNVHTPEAFSKRPELRRAVEVAVARIAGPTAAARLRIQEQPIVAPGTAAWGSTGGMVLANGVYYPGREQPIRHNDGDMDWVDPLIKVSLSRGLDSIQTAMHESWHAIEGTLSREEITILRAAVPQLRAYLAKVYPQKKAQHDRADETEIWAEAASVYAWQRMLEKAGPIAEFTTLNFEDRLHPAVRYVFDKIMNLLESIRNAVKGLGFNSANSIFNDFYRGEMGKRREQLLTEGSYDMLERWWAKESGEQVGDLDRQARLTQENSHIAKSAEGEDDFVPSQPALIPIRLATAAIHPGPTPPTVRQAWLHADRLGRLKKWWWGLDRLIDKFPNFAPLVKYGEITSMMRRETSRIHDAAIRIAKDWRALGNQTEGLAALIDDVTNMAYRTPSEIARGVVRHPTPVEFNNLVAKHKVSAAALRVFNMQKKFFSDFLQITAQNAKEHAQRTITDPVDLVKKLDAINNQVKALLAKPYFPFLRFGNHFVQVKDASGTVVHFETVERRGLQGAVKRQKALFEQLSKSVPVDHIVTYGVLPEQSQPFIGMPPALLESIASQLQLNAAQRDALDQLRYHLAPAASFAKRFIHKDYTPGYSHDFLRAFSRYAFHGARYYGKTKYSWMLQKEIDTAERMPGNLPGELANYMRDHLANTITNTRGDWGRLRGAIFTWVFAYSPAAAVVNLSQLTLSHNFMAAHFGGLMRLGDVKAAAALARALADVKNFYKRGSYDGKTQFWMRAMQYGIQSGRISEAMAAELAGISQGEPLLGMGNNAVGRGIQIFLEKGAFLFEMAEQVNRRATYRAALELAQKYPTSKAVKMAMDKYGEEYKQLLAKGFVPSEAQAIVTASFVVDQTQYSYAKENRPRVMRSGFIASLLVFKSYMLNTLQLLGANKTSVLPRYLLTMMLLAGLTGIPGAGEFEALANALGKWFFGKDFKLTLWLRKHLKDIVGEEHSDLVLHGLSSRGFGLPGLVDMMGEHIYGNKGRGLRLEHSHNIPFPQIDMSKALGMGNVLPLELDKVMDPGKDVNKAISEQTQRASGAVFGVGFNIYRAIMDTNTAATDWKRWERTMPRALASVSRAYRAFSEGRERGPGGPNSAASIIKYDARDPEQMAEILAVAAGFMPSRLSAQWDFIMAKNEVVSKIDFERTMLLRQMFEASRGQNPREIEDVNKAIRAFNEGLPDFAKDKALSRDTIHRSMQQRELQRRAREAGSMPTKKTERGIDAYMRGLFPKTVVDVRKVE